MRIQTHDFTSSFFRVLYLFCISALMALIEINTFDISLQIAWT